MTDEDAGDDGSDRPDEDLPPGAGDAATPAFGAEFEKSAAIQRHWEQLVDDVAATAAEFRERGWSVLELHPGDVTVVDAERSGFDVLVPDDEFEQLESWVENGDFDEHDVYLATGGIVFVLVVLRDEDTERAVCCPLYYGSSDMETLNRSIETEGALLTHVRRLSNDYVTFVHTDPAVFFPDDE